MGTIRPWGLNWLGTVCPEGPINWGPNVGDQMYRDHMDLGPNVSQPYNAHFFLGFFGQKFGFETPQLIFLHARKLSFLPSFSTGPSGRPKFCLKMFEYQ